MIAVVTESGGLVGSLAFSPDGMRLAMGDLKAVVDRGTRIWDILAADMLLAAGSNLVAASAEPITATPISTA